MIERDWHGCYKEGWNGQITPDSFAHPAKFSRGLIRRIYEHALERSYLSLGDTVLDPFGGVALGACDSISRGLNWAGVELEQKFVDLGNQNIDRWHLRAQHAETMGLDWGRAQLIQGDSRELGAVLREAGGVVSSPPYASNTVHGNHGLNVEKFKNPGKIGKTSHAIGPREMDDYGTTPGQLGAMRVVSSPPYAESVASDDPDKRGGLYRDPKRRDDRTLTAEYGESVGQLGRMRVVSSPPWEESLDRGTVNKTERVKLARRMGISNAEYLSPIDMERIGKRNQEYGNTAGQLGTETGSDFWTAARQIMGQVYQVLPPGAHATWVVKGFIRKKAYVDFPDQWRQLGEAYGFETIEWIRAWLVEDRGTQYDLFGGETKKKVERKSFFRRLAESKGSPRIDYEVVLIQRRCEVEKLHTKEAGKDG